MWTAFSTTPRALGLGIKPGRPVSSLGATSLAALNAGPVVYARLSQNQRLRDLAVVDRNQFRQSIGRDIYLANF